MLKRIEEFIYYNTWGQKLKRGGGERRNFDTCKEQFSIVSSSNNGKQPSTLSKVLQMFTESFYL